MTIAYEAVQFQNISATTAPFSLTTGGQYSIQVLASFGGGSVKLEYLGPDNTTYAEWDSTHTSFTASGHYEPILPPGVYKFVIATATAVYISLARIPQ